MELKEFIKTTIEEVFDAISESQEKYTPDYKRMNGVVVPLTPLRIPMSQTAKREIERISFDLSVSEQSEKSTGGKIGISVLSAGAEKDKSNNIAQHVSFSIPVYLPATGGLDQQGPSVGTGEDRRQ